MPHRSQSEHEHEEMIDGPKPGSKVRVSGGCPNAECRHLTANKYSTQLKLSEVANSLFLLISLSKSLA